MATVVDKQIVEEGPRNAVVKLTGVLTDANVNEISVVKPTDFSNNDRWQVLSGFLPNTLLTGYDGSINLVTTGFQAGTTQNFTIFLRLVKLYAPTGR